MKMYLDIAAQGIVAENRMDTYTDIFLTQARSYTSTKDSTSTWVGTLDLQPVRLKHLPSFR